MSHPGVRCGRVASHVYFSSSCCVATLSSQPCLRYGVSPIRLLSSCVELNSVSHLFPAFRFLGHPLRANSCAAAASRLLLSRFRPKNVGFPPRMQPLALGAVALAFGCLKKMRQK